MANVSDWKGFEKSVAAALGGKRRFRTVESYGKEADDVRFLKSFRKQFPKVRRVAVECKKRKNLNVHALFAEAKMKYGLEGEKRVIIATKVTHKRNLKNRIEAMKATLRKNSERKQVREIKKLRKRLRGSTDIHKLTNLMHRMNRRYQKTLRENIRLREIQLRLRHDITALVTVEMDFFAELWKAWLNDGNHYSTSHD